MKGIILAGGSGSRLRPLTKVTNKHLLPVGAFPMIYYPINQLIEAGIEDVLIITGVEHMGKMFSLLGSGRGFGCRFTYKVQDEAGGIAQALQLAEDFASGEPVVVLLGDNIFEDSLTPFINNYKNGAYIFLKEVPDPERFGIAEVKEGRIISIEEKPKIPKGSLAITGAYIYDSRVFGFTKELEPSDRGELEITDVNLKYLKECALSHFVLNGYWTDAGTFDSYKMANRLVNGK